MDDELKMEPCTFDDSESSGSGSGSGSDDDDCTPRIGSDFQVDELPRCTHDFFAAENGNHVTVFSADEEELAFALGGMAIPITSIRMNNEKKQDLGRDCDDQNEGELPEDKNGGGDGRRRKGKKKRKGNWLTFRRMRAKSSLSEMEDVIVPGDGFDAWEENEEAAFLLGLYLFGKDFNALKRFLETRMLTDLQHYYYSIFYGTPAYKRWVAARNNCSKRIVNGRHILVGRRQEELLRRLLPEVEECSRPELFETMAGFNKGEVSFERYVSRIKDIAGLELFVDSVGLGCGKRDLTMGSVDSVQATKKFELPPGKAFSDYTGTEMFRALSGGCRLSKSRAQDLFWEGVWPRLLAKDWSSEQSGKGPLVYMVPGIKRYSKRSLIKGKDYFDSISEVLNHVATDASFLELPELDNELMAKSQSEINNKRGVSSSSKMDDINTNGVVSERKRRPTLWLSKGTSHAFAKGDDQGDEDKDGEAPKEKKVDTPKEKKDEPAAERDDDGGLITTFLALPKQLQQLEVNCRTGNTDAGDPEQGKNSESRSESTSETMTTTTTATLVCFRRHLGLILRLRRTLTRWRSDYQHVLPSRKRSYDIFSERINSASSLQLQGGVAAAVGFSAQPTRTKTFFLDNMIKHYLGNGKSVRLYGPSTKLARANVAEALYKRFQVAFYRKEIMSLVLAVHLDWQQKMAKSIADNSVDERDSRKSSSKEELKLYELPEAAAAGQASSIASSVSSQAPPCCCVPGGSVDKNLSRIETEEMIQEDDGDKDGFQRKLVGSSCLRCSSRVQAGGT
ncbi:hypothetical protein SELMODRAFT_427999 [Selaginella moellendorffii]|uniref:SANT domain-containing protein n=1 Tax=Selaginella moellendorffii TaxID=88036 RepID=D8T1D6_SELML|nr:hypothetical protein SELMODRAFT_427999 [Selaginella moellendorffii]